MKSREDFLAWAGAALAPALAALEARRTASLTRVALAWTGLFLLGGMVAAFYGFDPNAMLFVLFGVVIVGIALSGLLTSGYKAAFKQDVMANLVKYFDEQLTYAPGSGIPETDFSGSRLFRQSIDRYHCEDLVSGQLGATAIAFSEVHAEYKTESVDSKGHAHTEWHTIFKGLFFVVDFNKNFNGATQVVPDTAERLLGSLGRALQKLDFSRPGVLIRLEDPEFEKEFAVFSTDQIEARYLLSTSLMRRILDFKTRWGRRVHLSFTANRLYVAVEVGENLFEPKLFRSLTKPEALLNDFEHLALAIGIVEDLNLNTRIWTKE